MGAAGAVRLQGMDGRGKITSSKNNGHIIFEWPDFLKSKCSFLNDLPITSTLVGAEICSPDMN